MVVERGKDVVIEGLACPPPPPYPSIRRKTRILHTYTSEYYFFFFYYVCTPFGRQLLTTCKNHHHHHHHEEETRLDLLFHTSSTAFKDFLKSHTSILLLDNERERTMCTEPRSLYSAAPFLCYHVCIILREFICVGKSWRNLPGPSSGT